MYIRKVFLGVALAALLFSSGCVCHKCHRRERWRDGCPCDTCACEPTDCGCGCGYGGGYGGPAPAPLMVGPPATSGPTIMMPPANPR